MSDQTDSRHGDCYRLSATYMLEHRPRASEPEERPLGSAAPQLQLCHGWPVLRGDSEHAGRRFGHAWVERSTVHSLPFEDRVVEIESVDCWDSVSGDWIPQMFYYRGGEIESRDVARYSLTEAVAMLESTEHYGPWHENPTGEALFRSDP